jgi:hypothetical protein
MRSKEEIGAMLGRFDVVVDEDEGDSDTDTARAVLNWVWNEQYPDLEIEQYLSRR